MLHRIVVGLATLVAAALASLAGAWADEPSFPPGSRIGLVPPPGMIVSNAFPGFQDAEHKVAIVLGELPADAFLQLEKGIFTDALAQQGIVVEQRQMIGFGTGMGFLVTARQEVEGASHRKWFVLASDPDFTLFVTVQRPESASDAYPEEAIRAALKTLATREVPRNEQLELFPFKMTELAGFPNVKTLVRGAALVLSDGTEGIIEKAEAPYLVVSVAPGPPPATADRGAFAQRVLAGITGYRDLRIVSSEPMRLGGMPGYELRAEGKHANTGAEVMLVQWLRFGPGGFLRVIGIAQKTDWPQAFTRFRAVRDGIEPR
jgi:hypothetical protein